MSATAATIWRQAHEALRLVIPHAKREVFDDHLGENHMPWHRLFLVPPASVAQGGQVFDRVARRMLPMTPGTITLLPQGRRYRFEFKRGLALIGFHFRLESCPGQDVLGAAVRFRQESLAAPEAAEAWQALGLDGADAWLRTEGLLRLHLGRLATLSWPAINQAIGVQRRWGPTLSALQGSSGTIPSIQALARRAGLSRAYFTRRFHEDLGEHPRAWRARRIAEHASQRLLFGSEPLQAIAADLGFSDAFSFSRFVRRCLGQSPAHLRRDGPFGRTDPP